MRRSSLLLLGIALLGGCTDTTPSGTLAAPSAPAASRAAADGRADNTDLAALRAATARFHRYEVARDANYTFLFMDMCMSSSVGGMGYHYVNTALLDGTVDVATPEALLYEPGTNGQLRLVGVEYVIPKSAWTSSTPPVLFGKSFVLNAFDLWALHVWAWEDNPRGLYADWNPRVTCDNAAP
jgi:hypothetical protein